MHVHHIVGRLFIPLSINSHVTCLSRLGGNIAKDIWYIFANEIQRRYDQRMWLRIFNKEMLRRMKGLKKWTQPGVSYTSSSFTPEVSNHSLSQVTDYDTNPLLKNSEKDAN